MILDARKSAVHWHEQRSLDACLNQSTNVWVGTVDGELVCVWGLLPPTLLSDSAYLWLYTTKKLEECKFLFIRQSQIGVEAMLKQYPTIVGMVHKSNDKAKKWIKWLGASFAEPQEDMIPFTIRAKNG